MPRGRLRIYLGAAPGVGKTFRMLEEGRRRRERGTDVVIGVVETHGRARTAEQIGDLEVVARRRVEHRGVVLEEMDVDAIVARAPQVALVDEFAHTNAPGSRHPQRWHDVEHLLEHGIDVISTLNVQHLASLADVVREITGAVQHETVPDEVVRRAEQVELVDMSAQALRRRLAHGNVYPAERVDAALASYFREGNLLSLRELALLWTAGRVDEALRAYRRTHAIQHPWETRERVVVGLDGRAGGEALLRRGARIAERTGGDLLAVHVAASDGLTRGSRPQELAALEQLARELGGSFQVVVGDDPAPALVAFARSEEATQLVLGSRRRSRLGRLRRGADLAERIVPRSGSIDVHIVSQDLPSQPRLGRAAPAMGRTRPRLAAGIGVGGLLVVVATAVMAGATGAPPVQTTYLLYLATVLIAAVVGGAVAAALVAVAASLSVNWFFTDPLHTFDIDRPENALALVLFVVFGVVLGGALELLARRRAQAERAAAEARLLLRLTRVALRAPRSAAALLEQMRTAFDLGRVDLEVRGPDGRWATAASSTGAPVAVDPDRAPDAAGQRATLDVDETRRVVVEGPPLRAADRRVMAAFAAQTCLALDTARLADEAAAAQTLAEGDAVRRALLAAVGHDLRTPLAGIKAAVSSLRQEDVQFSAEDERELQATIEESADRLDELLRDLLDMTRLESDALSVALRPVWLDEVLAPVLVEHRHAHVTVLIDEALPPVHADPALLGRVLSNVVANAVRHGGGEVVVRADAFAGAVEVRVVDRGPGVPAGAREAMFEPFHRLQSVPGDGGVGLGLAVARGFATAMGARIDPEDTPGGGLTMVVVLPLAPMSPPDASAEAGVQAGAAS